MVGDLAVGRYAVAEGDSMNHWPSDRIGGRDEGESEDVPLDRTDAGRLFPRMR